MRSTLFLVVFSLLISSFSIAQKTISGTVYSGDTHRPLAKAKVRMGNRNIRTDATGTFTLPFKKDESIECFALGFYDYKRKADELESFDQVSIYMTPKPALSGLQISSDAVGIYKPEFEYVFDFEFIDNLLIVGTHLNKRLSDPKRKISLQNCALTLLDKGKMVDRIIIPDFPQRLRKSAFNELYIEGWDYTLLVKTTGGKISIEDYDHSLFQKNILPWTAAFSNSASAVGMIEELPMVVHYMYFPEQDRDRTIRIAQNRNYFKYTYDDYTMLSKSQKAKAKKLSEKYNFNEKLYAGYIRDKNRPRSNRDVIFRDLRKPYTPAYKYQSDLLILDAMNQWIYRHDQQGETLDSTYFQINLPGEDLRRIQQDPISENLYAIHERSGVYYVRKLNPKTGALSSPLKIAFPYPEKVKIYNGNAFYIRHDSKEQFKHLYKESLNFH
jgi:hypothetical protein